jgi:hypothetical protein
MAELVFWCAAVLLVHTYFLYPVMLFVLDGMAQVLHNVRYMRSGANRRRDEQPSEQPRGSQPSARRAGRRAPAREPGGGRL